MYNFEARRDDAPVTEIRKAVLKVHATTKDVTRLLVAWGNGDETAASELMPLIYSELRRLANRKLAYERPAHTLQATALVNEVYLRLVDQTRVQWQNRAHFFAVSAQLMRRILVDYARSRIASKRGGSFIRVSLEVAAGGSEQEAADIMALDDALEKLSALDPRKAQLIELRFFGGLTIEEAAKTLNVSPGTAMRDWTLAKAWLRCEMEAAAGKDAASEKPR